MHARSSGRSRSLGLTAAVILVLAACAPASDGTSPSADSTSIASASPTAAGTVTLTDDGCTFVGPGTAPAGPAFMIEVVNTTAEASGFDLYRLHVDTDYAEWVAYNDAAQESFEQGGEGPGDPVSIADPIDLQVAVGAGASGTMRAIPGGAGTYALQCWIFPAAGVSSLFSAGPLVIE